MSRRSGLGRGIGALIPTDLMQESGSELREIAVSSVEANRFQPRTEFDESALVELSESIREMGVLQPILVRPLGEDRFELIAGERRWRAARRAGLATIPAVVRSVDDTTSLEHALVENLHRQDLSALEEAVAYQQLVEDFGLTQDEVARRVGKSRSAVANTLRLLHLPPTIQRMVAERRISAGHARALLGTQDAAFQQTLARRIAAEGLSVRDAEDAVRHRQELEARLAGAASDHAESDEPGELPSPVRVERGMQPASVLELESLLSDYLDTRVSVRLAQGKGRVSIEFANIEDLERIFTVITVEGNRESMVGDLT